MDSGQERDGKIRRKRKGNINCSRTVNRQNPKNINSNFQQIVFIQTIAVCVSWQIFGVRDKESENGKDSQWQFGHLLMLLNIDPSATKTVSPNEL